MSALKTSLEATAYHEAGHAVAHYLLHTPFRYVTIVPDSDYLGCVATYKLARSLVQAMEMGDPTTPQFRLKLESQIMTLMAGHIAEHKFTARHNNVAAGHDFAHLTDLALAICGEPKECSAYINWLYLRTQNLLGFESHWEGVQALAQALLTTPTIKSREAISVVDGAIHGKSNG